MEVARKSFTATGAEDRRWQGLVLASGVAGMVQHAAGEFVSAGENFGAGAVWAGLGWSGLGWAGLAEVLVGAWAVQVPPACWPRVCMHGSVGRRAVWAVRLWLLGQGCRHAAQLRTLNSRPITPLARHPRPCHHLLLQWCRWRGTKTCAAARYRSGTT